MITQRTHDREVYLRENRYEQPNELVKVVAARARESGLLRSGSIVCDLGCAAGEFLYHLRQQYPDATYYGYDVVPELLEKARDRVPGVVFREGSVLDSGLIPAASVDLALMMGVHSSFEAFEPPLANLLRWTRPGGRVFVVGLFNPFPVDVWVTYRLTDDPVADHREPGWNAFSKHSVSRYLDRVLGPGRHRFTPFELPFDLAPHPNDVIRTWTFQDREGRRRFTNGLSLICHIEILEIWP